MRLGTAPDENVETMASPIRGTGAERAVEVRAWALLLSVGLPDAAVTDAKPDGALHLLWFWGTMRLGLWVRVGDATTWEIKDGGRFGCRVAQGRIRYDGDPRPRDVQRLRRAIKLHGAA